MNRKTPSDDATDRVQKIPPIESPRHEEALLDQSVAETFPASDPIAPAVQARLDPADASLDDRRAGRSNADFAGLMRRSAPALAAVAAAALALMALRALRRTR